MKRMKKKLKSVKEIKREKSMSCSNLTTRSYPSRSFHSTVSISNVAEVENENGVEYSSSTEKHDSTSPDSSCGPFDASSLVSGSFFHSPTENCKTMTPTSDEHLRKEFQSTRPTSVSSQDYEAEVLKPRVVETSLYSSEKHDSTFPDSSCGPFDSSSLASGSFFHSPTESCQTMTPTSDENLRKEFQSIRPTSVSSQDYEESESPHVSTNSLVRKWSKRKFDHAVRILPAVEDDNIKVIEEERQKESTNGCIDVSSNECVKETSDLAQLVEEDAKDFYNRFQKISTIPVALLLIIYSLIMMILIFLLPILCEQKTKPHGKNTTESIDDPFAECYVDSFSILIYCHSFYWLSHLIWDQYLKKRHKEHRISGYLDFYLDIKNIRRAPFYIVSTCNFLLLIAMTLLHDYDNYLKYYYDDFRKVDWIRGLITIECMTIICLLAYYIRKINKFNHLKMPPDVMRESYMETLRANLAWEWDPKSKNENISDNTPEEVQEWDRKVKEALKKHQQAVELKLSPQNQHVHILQAELINFLVQQIKQKNKKLVNLIQQVSDMSSIVECNVKNETHVIVC